jgi:UDP-N-acetylmuramyl-tripeptide synthetase
MSLISDLGISQEFTMITADSRQVQPGALFLAYPGVQSDGRNFIDLAIKAGAIAVLWEPTGFSWPAGYRLANIAVENLKQQAAQIAADYYQQPSQHLTMVGVTGTNGKTSVSLWLAQCLSRLGQKTAVLGTVGNGFVGSETAGQAGAELTVAANTTPDAILLQSMLADFKQQQAKAVVMEVSSHGLDQGRVNGVKFDLAILTNLSRDHLDYHLTMENYAAAKAALFVWPGLRRAIVNADDALGQKLIASLKTQARPMLTYGLLNGDVRGSELQLQQQALTMQIVTPQGSAQLTAPVLGRFNAYNILAVLAALLALDIRLADALAVISEIQPVAGRMQQLGGAKLPLVVIDYAHTPDALEKVLLTLREQLPPSAKLICVFGCGGERDAGKRALMGAIASKLADQVIVTSDNPRHEAQANISQAIVSGISGAYLLAENRASAIAQAIAAADAGDIVLLAGKGHENYQEIAGQKIPFSDMAEAQSALRHYPAVHHAQTMQHNGTSV